MPNKIEGPGLKWPWSGQIMQFDNQGVNSVAMEQTSLASLSKEHGVSFHSKLIITKMCDLLEYPRALLMLVTIS